MSKGNRRLWTGDLGRWSVIGRGQREVRRGVQAAYTPLEALEPRVLLSGQIFVTNSTINTIGEYTTSGAVVNAALISGLSNPEGIAVSGSYLFVANSGNGTIGEYTTSGATVNAALISGLSNPTGLAVSGSYLFVTNYTGNTIGEYTTAGATVNASLISGLANPAGIAVAGSVLFVTNANDGTTGGGTIGEYTTSGATLNVALLGGLNEPVGIAVSGANLFITNYGNGSNPTIGEYTTSGATVNGSLISGLANFGPLGIVVSGADLFVANIDNGTIGNFTTSGGTVNASLVAGLSGPYGIALVSSSPVTGYVDVANTSVVSGWAYDPTAGAAAVNVRVDIDGVMGTPFAANLARPDLLAVVGSTNHGFSMVMPNLQAGPNTISVYEVPAGGTPVLLATDIVIGPRATNPPMGYIDAASASSVTGWAFDPNGGANSIGVQVFVDGVLQAGGVANITRNDLTPVVGSPNHGFSLSWSGTGPGSHTIQVYAFDYAYGIAVLLGTAVVTNHAPIGNIDVVDATHVAGWTLDPDSPTTSINMRVDIDGVAGTPFQAAVTRNDLIAPYGSANHGFNFTYPSLPLAPGFHRIDVWAVDAQTGALTLLGSRTVDTITPPIGYVDAITTTSVSGWAYDAAAGAQPINVEVVIDGIQRPAIAANVYRADLVPVVGSANHGFSYGLPELTPGAHTIVVYAINPQNSSLTLLGSGSVTVVNNPADKQPIGNVDIFSATQVAGWAFAYQSLASPVFVRIDVDGVTVVTPSAATGVRNDLTPVVGSADHGYNFALSLTPNESHVVDVYYIDPQTSVAVLFASKLFGTAAPIGWVDSLNSTTISGWALDTSDGPNPIDIRVDVDGQVGATAVASDVHAGLTALYGSANHGFTIPAPKLAPGLHTIVVWAINPYTLATVEIGAATVTYA